jgi:hypothetical protein
LISGTAPRLVIEDFIFPLNGWATPVFASNVANV